MITRSPFAIVLVVVALPGCGGSGDSNDKPIDQDKPAGTTTPPRPAANATTFAAPDVAFTFHFPQGFKQVDEPNDGKVLASVTPTPNDVNNGLKIRKTAEKELPFASYAAQIRGQFEAQLGTKVSQSQGKRGTLDLGVLQWTKAYTKDDLGTKKTIQLYSKSYFFIGGGKTWQLECLSSEERLGDMKPACQQALGSIEFAAGG